MDLNKLPLFALISRRMEWLTDRQRVLAQNVANVDTPGFVPSDLKPMNFRHALAGMSRVKPRQTAAQHLGGVSATGGSGAALTVKSGDKTISGNAVSMDNELMKVTETAVDYQLITNLYRKQLSMLRTAIGRGGSS